MIDTLNNEKIAKYLLTHDIVTLKLVLDSMLHSMLTLSKSMRGKKVKHEYDNYANLMFQMILSKAIVSIQPLFWRFEI